MENINYQLADTFWKTHFPELYGRLLTERGALDSDFWNELQLACNESNPDTLWAVVLANPPMQLEVMDMFTRIKRIAKHTWDKKRD